MHADVDECANSTLNSCTKDKNQVCKNTDGSYDCDCQQGFQRMQIGAEDICQG